MLRGLLPKGQSRSAWGGAVWPHGANSVPPPSSKLVQHTFPSRSAESTTTLKRSISTCRAWRSWYAQHYLHITCMRRASTVAMSWCDRFRSRARPRLAALSGDIECIAFGEIFVLQSFKHFLWIMHFFWLQGKERWSWIIYVIVT